MHALPRGFRFAGVSSGLKKSGSKDLAVVVSETPAVAAGVYTRNQVVAPPVLVCRERTPGTNLRALVVNSGNANACTGERGLADAYQMCHWLAEALGCESQQVLVMSTGVIGKFLNMEKVASGIETAAQSLDESYQAFVDAADGIRTTDNDHKIACREMTVGDETVRLCGMAKGAGMIGPKMATMLCCLATDAKLNAEQAQRLLQASADLSFNNISVEGHTSTNDSMVLLANGVSKEIPPESQLESQFAQLLNELCIELAKKIPADGEGATHLIEIQVKGATSVSDARQIAETVAASNLVKTAVFGNDPNWGRIVSAAGYAGPALDLKHLSLRVNGIPLFMNGEPLAFDESQASRAIRDQFLTVIELSVGTGSEASTHWTSDLTVDYVRFNSEYTT